MFDCDHIATVPGDSAVYATEAAEHQTYFSSLGFANSHSKALETDWTSNISIMVLWS